MNFIELHINSEPLLLNVNLIESIKPSSYIGKAQIYMAAMDADNYWITDESYEQVVEKIYAI